jgi:NhaA family Na+:H+ antiporter
MEFMIPPVRRDRPVNHRTDHTLGSADTEVTPIRYGSYVGPQCKRTNDCVAQARDRISYAFRCGTLADDDLVYRVAELIRTRETFWSAPIKPMTSSTWLMEHDLGGGSDAVRRARARVSKRSRLLGRQDRSVCRIDCFRRCWDYSALGKLRLKSLSRRRRRALIRKYQSPPRFMADSEQEILR